MQKYGVSNSSGRRMTCAPRAAAWRTSCSALAMLSSVSQSHAIWMAATVTGRGVRRKCSGSLDIDGLSITGNSRAILLACPRLRPGRGGREVHLSDDAHGRLQRHESGLARNHRRAAAANALEERVDLRLERISGLQALLLDRHRQRTRGICRPALADECEDLLLQIK